MNDDERDYFDEVTENRWPAGWWVPVGLMLGLATIGGLIWLL